MRGIENQFWKKHRREGQKILLLSTKIALGSTLAIFVARQLELSHDVSAGTITMLTLMTTKWQTVKLSVSRVLTFVLAIFIAWVIFLHVGNAYAAYGVFMFLLVCISAMLGLTATVSVNAVIGAHLFTGQDFSMQTIGNEFKLVCIGIVIALVLNLYHDNGQRKKELVANMRAVEQQLQKIILELAAYLIQFQMSHNLWGHIRTLERQLETYIQDAHEYQDNTFHFHPEYYIDYFEMRHAQCQVLDSLHNEMRRVRSRPKQAQIIAEYLLYVADYVVEINSPEKQLNRLHEIFADMKREELPKTREEFESRAMLYHILMDMEEFLLYKKRFVCRLDKQQREIYWKK